MKRSTPIIGLTAVAVALPLGAMSASATEAPPAGATVWTEWISDDGGAARELPAISASGRYVVMAGRSSAADGIWIKDRLQPTKPAWQLADGSLFNPDISADGSTVVWTQYGTAGSGGQQIWYLKWQQAGATPRVVSLGDDGQQADKLCDYPTVSGNGRYVAFQSMDMTLDAQATPGASGGNRTKAYVRDTLTGDTEMVSVVGTNTIPNGSGMKPDITPDGRYVAFYSDATALQGVTSEEDGEEETTTYQQVYRRDRVAKTTIPVSVATTTVNVFGDGASSPLNGPSISDDGNKVAFESAATNLVDGDTNADIDAFVRDISGGTTTRVSVDSNGAQVDTDDTDDVADGEIEDDPATNEDESGAVDALPVGSGPAISGDGSTVAYASMGAMTTDDTNGVSDVYTMRLAGGMGRGSMVDDPADTNAFEASGTRTDGHTGETVAASNGADPALTRTGNAMAFTSQGNLTGIAASEEGEDTGEETEPATSIEPNIYVRRPNPDADLLASGQSPVVGTDTKAPSSRVTSPTRTGKKYTKVRYTVSDTGSPASGVKAVRLYIKKPGWTKFKWLQTDVGTRINGLFTVKTSKKGIYKFYTVAVDKSGNVEKRPAAGYDDKTRRR